MTQYTKPKLDRASDMFWDALQGGASSYVICDCGTDWQPPEDLDEEDSYDWFRYVELEGKTFVADCEACCAKLARYEQWIWNQRHEIRDYLRIRVDQQLKWAEQEKLLNTIAGIDRRV
jgi:hypothetical protein